MSLYNHRKESSTNAESYNTLSQFLFGSIEERNKAREVLCPKDLELRPHDTACDEGMMIEAR